MMKRIIAVMIPLVCVVMLAIGVTMFANPQPALANLISTTFSSNNDFQGNMFDLSNISSNPIELTVYFEGNFQTGATGTVEMWYRTGSYVGHESDLTGWTILGTAAITSNGTNVPTPYNVGNTLLVNTGVTFGMFMYLDGT